MWVTHTCFMVYLVPCFSHFSAFYWWFRSLEWPPSAVLSGVPKNKVAVMCSSLRKQSNQRVRVITTEHALYNHESWSTAFMLYSIIINLQEYITSQKSLHKNAHTALFKIFKTLETIWCPSTAEWTNELWCIYKMEYYSAIKRNELWIQVMICKNLKRLCWRQEDLSKRIYTI